MRKRLIELAVLDMAGTTVYDGDAVNICLREALGHAGVDVGRDAVNAVMGLPKPLAIRKLLSLRPFRVVSNVLVNAVYQDFEQRMLAHYRLSPEVREADGAVDTFLALRARGIRIVLDTGFNRMIADAILKRLQWTIPAIIDGSVASDEVRNGRPAPDMIIRAMVKTGVTHSHKVAKVGDTPSDLEQGQVAACGLIVGVTSGSHARDELEHYPHTHLIQSLPELVEIIDGENA